MTTTLNPTALATLASYDITPGQWIAVHGYQGQWTGDACGCSDDRCIGHHHHSPTDCHCLEVLIDQLCPARLGDVICVRDTYDKHTTHRDHNGREWTGDGCTCVFSCADDPDTACHLSGQWHTHPDEEGGFGPCPAHPDAPGDR